MSSGRDIDGWQRRLVLRAGFSAGLALPASRVWAAERTRQVRIARKIHIDPGHGGRDPGAIGAGGTLEKHVTLATATELTRLLTEQGHAVSLSRAADAYVALDERVRAAEAAGAEVFVSLHADAFEDRDVRGASFYTLSADASDAFAQAVADSENARGDAANGAMADDPGVADILADLTRAETRAKSARLGRAIAQALGAASDDELTLMPGPERHAGFVVLQSATIPSVLVEMGFISNADDEAALNRAAHRARIADAVRTGIARFLAGQTRIAG